MKISCNFIFVALCILLSFRSVVPFSEDIPCEDSRLYLDRFGLRCENYVTIDCEGMGVVGFRTYEIRAVLKSCPLSCGICRPKVPTISPSVDPSAKPTHIPSYSPSFIPSSTPSKQPTKLPSTSPTSHAPSEFPTIRPTNVQHLTPSSSPSHFPVHKPSLEPTGFGKRTVQLAPFEISIYPSSVMMVDQLKLFLSTTDLLLRNLVVGLYPKVSDVSFSTVILDQSASINGRKLEVTESGAVMAVGKRLLEQNTTLTMKMQKTALISSVMSDITSRSDGITKDNLEAAVKFIFDENSQMRAPLIQILTSKYFSTFGSIEKISFTRFLTELEMEGYKSILADTPDTVEQKKLSWTVIGSMAGVGAVIIIFVFAGLVQLGNADDKKEVGDNSSIFRRKPWKQGIRASSPCSVSSVGMHSAAGAKFHRQLQKKKRVAPTQRKNNASLGLRKKRSNDMKEKVVIPDRFELIGIAEEDEVDDDMHDSGNIHVATGAFIPVNKRMSQESIDSIAKEINAVKAVIPPAPNPLSTHHENSVSFESNGSHPKQGGKSTTINRLDPFIKSFDNTENSSVFFTSTEGGSDAYKREPPTKASKKTGKELALERAKKSIRRQNNSSGVIDDFLPKTTNKQGKKVSADTQHRFPYYQEIEEDSFLDNPDKFFLESASYSTNGEKDYSFQMTNATLATVETGVGSVDKQQALQQINEQYFKTKSLPSSIPEKKPVGDATWLPDWKRKLSIT
uniref:ShKT domain-containing protein n=1 Tax=Corethron hystrix TaxID=216773 RepID=A0A7S1BDR9_9STRA|mmetsp:Transcript_22929/g.52526  ORF Transcript_22929/g.52526 Transcript_22929/m.52526 type:complete len:735 (+) Transcript_22929:147-2351(+)